MTLARVSNRIWKMHTEKFVDYAEEKLTLQFLNLTEKEKFELLADGVKDHSLRRFALNTWANTVPEFIEHIRKISEYSISDSIVFRRQEQGNKSTMKPTANGEKSCTHCKKSGYWAGLPHSQGYLL